MAAGNSFSGDAMDLPHRRPGARLATVAGVRFDALGLADALALLAARDPRRPSPMS
ncbi:hypothetical protein ACFQU7_16920 [Pseudoroseomonas wenyumeiae]